jgi:ligand-binding sensor domain-containing protein
LGLAALVPACESDPVIPPVPEPPPQIGISKTYVHSSQGLPVNDVYAFLLLSTGEFWIGTSAGIARYASTSADNRTGDVVTSVNGLPHPQVTSMVEHSGKVYVGTWGGGLGVYDIAGGAWSQIRPTPSGLTDGFVAEVDLSPTEDRLYLATNDGVFIYNPAAGTFVHEVTVDQDLLDRVDSTEDPLTDPEKEVMALQRLVSSVEVIENAGVVERWYGPRVEIKVDASQQERLGILVSKTTAAEYKYTVPNSGLIESNVNDIFFDATRSTYWVAYVTEGISEVNVTAKTWVSYTLVEGLPSNTVYAVTRAKDNASNNSVIWAATQDGLAKLVNNKWQSYGVSGGLPSGRVRSLYSDDGIRLWVGFVDAGAARINLTP